MNAELTSRILAALAPQLPAHEEKSKLTVLVRKRIRITPARFRTADICVVPTSAVIGKVLSTPPCLCIEIVSPEARMTRVTQRAEDYLRVGVPCVWLLSSQNRWAFTVTASGGLREVESGILKTENPASEVPLAQVFEA